MKDKETKKVLTNILNALPEKGDFSSYAFYCSNEYNFSKKEYKNYPIFFSDKQPKGSVYFREIESIN